MNPTADQINALVAQAKSLPEERQRQIVETLRKMLTEPCQLPAEETSVLRPALAEAQAGLGLSEAGTGDLPVKPWS